MFCCENVRLNFPSVQNSFSEFTSLLIYPSYSLKVTTGQCCWNTPSTFKNERIGTFKGCGPEEVLLNCGHIPAVAAFQLYFSLHWLNCNSCANFVRNIIDTNFLYEHTGVNLLREWRRVTASRQRQFYSIYKLMFKCCICWRIFPGEREEPPVAVFLASASLFWCYHTAQREGRYLTVAACSTVIH